MPRMPFRSVPCSIWLAHQGERDDYGNVPTVYNEQPDVQCRCCYAPGTSKPDTSDDIEDGRPHGDVRTMTFFLPNTVDADLRGARIACHPPNDSTLGGRKFEVVGAPVSYMRENTPGDYSWSVEGVEFLG